MRKEKKENPTLPACDAWTLPQFFAGAPISKSFFYSLPPDERPRVRMLRGKRVILREEYLEWLRSLPLDGSRAAA